MATKLAILMNSITKTYQNNKIITNIWLFPEKKRRQKSKTTKIIIL